MINRRNFLKIFSAAGVTLPAFGSASLASAKKNNPVILCSRGDYWGRKVLKPGWDILSSNSRFLSPFITMQSALKIAFKRSLNGPDGIIKPFPINCLELKQTIEKFGLIEKS